MIRNFKVSFSKKLILLLTGFAPSYSGKLELLQRDTTVSFETLAFVNNAAKKFEKKMIKDKIDKRSFNFLLRPKSKKQ